MTLRHCGDDGQGHFGVKGLLDYIMILVKIGDRGKCDNFPHARIVSYQKQ